MKILHFYAIFSSENCYFSKSVFSEKMVVSLNEIAFTLQLGPSTLSLTCFCAFTLVSDRAAAISFQLIGPRVDLIKIHRNAFWEIMTSFSMESPGPLGLEIFFNCRPSSEFCTNFKLLVFFDRRNFQKIH